MEQSRWYRNGLMLRHLMRTMPFEKLRDDSLIVYQSQNKRVGFYLKTNPEKKIYHKQQVALNAFIQSVLPGTKEDENRYKYFGGRAYAKFID